LLASAGNDRIVRIWSTADQKLVAELEGHEQPICSLAFHPDGQRLASADHVGIVKDWDLTTFRRLRDIDGTSTYFYSKSNRGTGGGLRQLLFSPDGQQLIGAGIVAGGDPLGQAVNPGLIVFDWSSGQRKLLLKASGNELGVAWGLVYHPTKHFVAAASGGMSAKHVYFWKTTEELPFHMIELPSPGRSIALHPGGGQMAVALHDAKIQIYSFA
jgi:WD40 repeat protein